MKSLQNLEKRLGVIGMGTVKFFTLDSWVTER